ncbi:hypothetical protein EJB05_00868, partial [Eragrostis curvula]
TSLSIQTLRYREAHLFLCLATVRSWSSSSSLRRESSRICIPASSWNGRRRRGMEIAHALIYSKFNTAAACDAATDPIRWCAVPSARRRLRRLSDPQQEGVLGLQQYLELHTRPTTVYRENEQSHFPLRICDQIIMDEALEV